MRGRARHEAALCVHHPPPWPKARSAAPESARARGRGRPGRACGRMHGGSSAAAAGLPAPWSAVGGARPPVCKPRTFGDLLGGGQF